MQKNCLHLSFSSLRKTLRPSHKYLCELRAVILFAFFTTTILPLQAEERVYTISEAMQMALENSLNLKIRETDVTIEEQGLRQAKAQFDPQLSASYSNDDGNFSENKQSVSVGVSGNLQTGTRYSISLDSSSRDTDPDLVESFAGLSFTQPLLRGFGLKSNLASTRIARRNLEQTEWQLKQSILDTLNQTVIAYNNLFLAQQRVAISRSSRDLAAKLVEDNQKRIEYKALASLDGASAEAQLAVREESLLQSELLLIQAKNSLKGLIFEEAQTALNADVLTESYLYEIEIAEFQSYLDQLLENQPSFRIAEIALEIAQLRSARDRNHALPSLEVIASIGFSSVGDSLSSSFNNLDSNNAVQSNSIGVNFSYPLWNRSRDAQKIISQQLERISAYNLERVKKNIFLEFHSSYEQVKTNLKRVEATRKAQELAQVSLDAEEKKLNAGTSTTFVVLRLQNDLANAELRAVNAIASANRSVAGFYRLLGTLEP